MVETPDNYVIKVYSTEDGARTDDASVRLDVDNRDTGGIMSKGFYSTDNQYFVGFRKYWYRFEFNEPVAAFYIDWDDGEDNSREKSNSQVVVLDVPNTFGIISHIYTKSGKFFPLVRAIGTDGFWSKYYTSNNSSNSFAELEETTLTAGQNEKSIVSLDLKDSSNSDVRIPYFYPTTLPPVGVLKVDRKSVSSGIDNETIHIDLITRGAPSTVYAWYSGEANSPSVHKPVEVDVTYETIGGEIKKETIHTRHQNAAISSSANVAIGDVWKIIDVELTKATEHTTKGDGDSALLHPEERVYLRWSNIASVQDATNPFITGETAPSASLTNKVFIKSPSHNATEAAIVAIAGTTNFNGRFTVETDYAISGFTDHGATVTVTSGDALGTPVGEYITLTGAGDLTGDHQVTAVTDANNIVITTAAGPPGGGSPRFSTRDGFMAVGLDIGGGMPADEGATGAWGLINTASDRSVCNVSTGWPKLTLNQRGFFVTADLSESRTRAPNLTIPETAGNLLLDDGKHDWGDQTRYLKYATDTLDDVITVEGTEYHINRLTNFRTRMEYTHDPFEDVDTWTGFRDYIDNRDSSDPAHTQDGTYRFFDSYRLLRCQVKDDRTSVANDRLAYSEIESFSDYSGDGNSTTILPSEVARQQSLWITLNSGGTWTDKNTANKNANTTLGSFTEQALTSGPANYFLLANSQRQFDRLFFATKNEFDNDINEQEGGLCRLSIFYPAYDARRDEIKFRAIPFEDYTKTAVDDSSLYLNGPVVFEAPDNWEKCKYNTSGLVWPNGVTANSNWDFDAYVVLIGVACEQVSVTGGTSDPPDLTNIFPYDNDHSEVIKVTDSMHVSLNSIVIAQSLSFKRQGKYIRVDDRIGRSELRKIGSEGGSIRFGGISFGDYSTAAHTGYDDYELVKRYQQEGTPVYLDLTRPNGEIVRFFGKITNMSEDVPTGRVSEKWAVEMQTEAVAEFNSDGTWLSKGLLSLGGILENEPKYL